MNKASKINTPPIPVFRKLMDTTPNVTRADLAEYLGVSASTAKRQRLRGCRKI